MNAPARPDPRPDRMTAEAYILWALDQPQGRFELVNGEVVEMASERAGHARAKIAAFMALRSAVEARGIEGEVLTDGMAVRVGDHSVFEPDAQVRLGPRLPDDTVLLLDPVIVVEVLSPSTRSVDTGKKLTGYFALHSLRHYLVLDPDERTVVHHRRPGESPDGPIETRILHARHPGDGPEDCGPDLLLDPPGLALRCADLFESP